MENIFSSLPIAAVATDSNGYIIMVTSMASELGLQVGMKIDEFLENHGDYETIENTVFLSDDTTRKAYVIISKTTGPQPSSEPSDGSQ